VSGGHTFPDCFSFGRLHWLRRQRVLLRAGRPVRLGSRAREILALLLENPGAVVKKETIMTRVWSGRIVEDVAVRVHVTGLRRTLGEGESCHIQNIRGIGYRFVAASAADLDSAGETMAVRTTDLIGREKFIAEVHQRTMQQRLLTLVGPAGAGKSAVARAVADSLRELQSADIRVVDVSTITNSLDFDSTLARNLRRNGERECVLVIDNCDERQGAVARWTEQTLTRDPRARILATSREALGANFENVLHLPPLELPSRIAQLSAAEALESPAVRLFVMRASASDDTFELTNTNAATVARLCTQLDGLPLTLELAAIRVHEVGLAALADSRELLLDLLVRGQRTAAPRQRTLRAMLDTSYDSLSPLQQLALRRLAVFSTGFDKSCATKVLVDRHIQAADMEDILARLTAASVLQAKAKFASVKYRLLNTQRTYALSKLRDTPEYENIRRRHALLCCARALPSEGHSPLL
jgi:predicted ATPase